MSLTAGLTLVLASLASLGVGCAGEGGAAAPDGGGSGGTGGGGNSGACDAPTKIFKPTCANMEACHKTGGFYPPFLDVDPVGQTVDKPAILSLGPCTGMPLVNSADPAKSVMLYRLEGETYCVLNGLASPRMPSGLPPLGDADMQCVRDWVTAQKK